MINLAPINSKVRAELHRRQLTLNREGPNFADPQTTSGAGPKADMNNIFSKATWLRMSSFLEANDDNGIKPRIIQGGALADDGTTAFGFDDIYTRPQSDGSKTWRPIPGVKSISVEFKGNLSSLRQATISWTVWTLEELEEYTPNFLQHGKTVLIEWGWSYNKTNVPLLADSDMTITNIYQAITDKVKQSGGTYDAMLGIISSYEWSVRDDGGIDCSTTLTSLGVNMLKQQTIPANTTNISMDTETGNPESTPSFYDFVDDMDKWLKHNRALDTSGKWNARNTNVFFLGEPPKREIYVSWGWLEDNVFSRYMGWLSSDNKIGGSLRSIEPWMDEDGNFITIADALDKMPPWEKDELKKHKIDESQTAYRSSTISNHAQLMAPNYKFFILPGQHLKSTRDVLEHPILNLPKTAFFDASAEVPSHNSARTHGYVRNILFNWQYLMDNIFKGANDMSSVLKSLFTKMNTEVGLWDLSVISAPDDESRLKVIDMALTPISITTLLENESAISSNWEDATGALFMFPTWGKGSIVLSQQLSGKLPSSMAVASMYSGNSGTPDLGKAGGIQGIALGGMSKRSKDKILADLKPAYKFIRFGSKVGSANVPLKTDNGFFLPPHDSELLAKLNPPEEAVTSGTKEAVTEVTEESKKITLTAENLYAWKSAKKLKNVTYNEDGTMLNTADYKYLDTMKYLINGDPKDSVMYDSAPLIPLSLELTLDGISGVYPGNCFGSDYVPKSYKEKTLFQITSATHEIDSSGWKTTISGQIRVDMSKLNPNTPPPQRPAGPPLAQPAQNVEPADGETGPPAPEEQGNPWGDAILPQEG